MITIREDDGLKWSLFIQLLLDINYESHHVKFVVKRFETSLPNSIIGSYSPFKASLLIIIIKKDKQNRFFKKKVDSQLDYYVIGVFHLFPHGLVAGIELELTEA